MNSLNSLTNASADDSLDTLTSTVTLSSFSVSDIIGVPTVNTNDGVMLVNLFKRFNETLQGFTSRPKVEPPTDEHITDNLGMIIPLGFGLYSLSLITFFGNAMVVHVIRTERKLRTVSNMFILSLAIADLIVGLIVMPISSAYVLTGDWIFGLFVCQFWLIIDYTASTASIFNLLILSLDRYWSIKSPLKYLCKRTKKRALAMIVIVWLLAACWIVPIIGWHHWYNYGNRKHDGAVCETEFSDDAIFKVTTSVVNFLIPMSLMVILYYKIYKEIKRRGKFDIIGSASSHGNGHSGKAAVLTGAAGKRINQSDGSLCNKEIVDSSPTTIRPKGYRKSWSTSNAGKRTQNKWYSNSDDPRVLPVCCSSTLNLPSTDCSSSLLPNPLLKSSNINIERCSSDDTFTQEVVSEADGDLELPIEVVRDGIIDYDNVHRYKQLIVLKAGNRAYSLEDYKDVDVRVEYIESGLTESTLTTTGVTGMTSTLKADSSDNNSSQQLSSKIMVMDGLRNKAIKFCRRKTGKSSPSSTSLPNDHQLSCPVSLEGSECSPSNGLPCNSDKKMQKGYPSNKNYCQAKWPTNCRSKFQSSFSGGDRFIHNDLSPGLAHRNKAGSSFNHHHSHPHHHHHYQNHLHQSNLDHHGSFSYLSSSSIQSHKNVMRRVESSRLRQEKKAARQLGVILGAFIICWLPYVIVFIVTAYCSCINHFVHTMAIWLGYFNSTINPFLYALCNENFKSAFRKMLARGASSKDNFTVNQQHGASFKYSQK